MMILYVECSGVSWDNNEYSAIQIFGFRIMSPTTRHAAVGFESYHWNSPGMLELVFGLVFWILMVHTETRIVLEAVLSRNKFAKDPDKVGMHSNKQSARQWGLFGRLFEESIELCPESVLWFIFHEFCHQVSMPQYFKLADMPNIWVHLCAC